eukprot:11190843-Lingulodinium_polyedra.AAC.1
MLALPAVRGQIFIVATVAQACRHLLTADIEKAFFQGMACGDTTEVGRSIETKEVNFEFPGGSVSLLQQ